MTAPCPTTLNVSNLDAHEQAAPPSAPVAPPPSGGHALSKVLLEVVLIAAGVFVGLAGEQWRENAEHRENARVALQRLRTEIATNRTTVARVKDYHARTRASLKAYPGSDTKARQAVSVKVEGVQVVFFEHTAWDLALATGALAHIDSDLAFDLSRIYNTQQASTGLTHSLTHAMYVRPPTENLDGWLAALAVYYDDIVRMEPELLKLYDDILPKLDRTLGKN
jgi:hypothetical protein